MDSEKKANIKSNTALAYVGYILKYLSPLILVPYYSRVLGPDGYGQVLAALSLMSIVGVVVMFGFSFSGIRELAAARSPEESAAVMGRQLVGRFLLVPVALVIGVCGTYFSPLLRGDPLFGLMATLLGISSAFGLAWFFQGIQEFKKAVFFDALFYPINIGLVLLLVRDSHDGLLVLASLLVTTLVCFSITYIFVRRKTSVTWVSIRQGFQEIKNTVTFFLSTASTVILTAGSTYILTLMIHVPEQVGYYGAAEKLITLGIGLLTPIAQVLLPTIASLQKDSSPEAPKLVRKGIILETGYGIAALVGGALLAPFVIPLLLGESFQPSVAVFSMMLVMMPFTAVKHAITIYILIPSHQEKYFLWVSSLNVFLSLALAFLLVPEKGIMGMALARVISEVTATLFLLAILYKKRA